MLDRFIFGRYLKGDSFIHRLDPRTKLMGSFFFIMIIFLANNWQTYLAAFSFIVISLILSKIPFGFFLRGVRPLIWLITFTVLLQIFFTQGGTPYFRFGWMTVTDYGLTNGIFIFCRFILIIFMSTLMTLTTPPLMIADAIESILKPLKVFKFPVHELALMLSIALRFVPTLMDEAQKIMNAQKSRGVEFGEGHLIEKMKSIIPILVPLFISSFNRAEDLAIAMEARGYQGSENRTKYRVLTYQKRDMFAAIAFMILLASLLGLRQW
ncbi:energy-coupling factor transporter transmembrane component T family protein [Atopobacter phocae]|uniref:energy-coupling factor transporter transmembrane component T family protein n=1 Tax=Atopobacter phocae TaxID=136492 RepID=UPI00047049C9|nr:energy-coupling factor transporter transmembrane component T [Atopobacter phocae]